MIKVLLIFFLTNHAEFPAVARYFTGFSILIIGLVGTVSLITTVIMLVSGAFEALSYPLVFLIVFGAAWALEIAGFFKIPISRTVKRLFKA